MSSQKVEQYEFSGSPSVRYVTDQTGRGWYCYCKINKLRDLQGQGCASAEEYVYDRGFGG